jgi:hypothetical protein
VNIGSHVRTHGGDGTVIALDHDKDWTFGRPNRRAWVRVEHEDGRRGWYLAHTVEELDEIEWPE